MKKDPHIESALELMNQRLVDVEDSLLDGFHFPRHPIVFVIGAQRSGTTILTQTLATLYRISYPSNLIARFWQAPCLGSLVSRSIGLENSKLELKSQFGATGDINGPHEFSYFWRNWFPGSAQTARSFPLSDDNVKYLNQQFAAWQSIGEEPLLFKNLLEVIPNIKILSEALPTSVFLNITRDDLYVIQSTHESRRNYGGSYQEWFGVKPGNFREIMKQPDPLLQVVEQVINVKREISSALSHLPSHRSLTISYEDFVSRPKDIISRIESAFDLSFWRRPYCSVDQLDLKPGNSLRLSGKQVKSIKRHCESLV